MTRFQLLTDPRLRECDSSTAPWIINLKKQHESEFQQQAESLYSALKRGPINTERTAQFVAKLDRLRDECSDRLAGEYERWRRSRSGGDQIRQQRSRHAGKENIRPVSTASSSRKFDIFSPAPVIDEVQHDTMRASSYTSSDPCGTVQEVAQDTRRYTLLTPQLEKPVSERTLPPVDVEEKLDDPDFIPVIEVEPDSPRKRHESQLVSPGSSPTITPKKPKEYSPAPPAIDLTIKSSPKHSPPPLSSPSMGNSSSVHTPSPGHSPRLAYSPDIRAHLPSDSKYSVPRELQHWEIGQERMRRLEAINKVRESEGNTPASSPGPAFTNDSRSPPPTSYSSFRPSPAWPTFSAGPSPAWSPHTMLHPDSFGSDDEEDLHLKLAATTSQQQSPFYPPKDTLFGPSPSQSPALSPSPLPQDIYYPPPRGAPPSHPFPSQKSSSRAPTVPPSPAFPSRSRRTSTNAETYGNSPFRPAVNLEPPTPVAKPQRGHKRSLSRASDAAQQPARTPRPDRTPYLSPSMFPQEPRAGTSPRSNGYPDLSSASSAAWGNMVVKTNA